MFLFPDTNKFQKNKPTDEEPTDEVKDDEQELVKDVDSTEMEGVEVADEAVAVE